MPLLLVDDRDGRIVAEVETEAEAERIVSGWRTDDGNVPSYLCLVSVQSHQGAFIGTDTSVKVRPLPRF